MPIARNGDIGIHWQVEGRGDGPPLLLLNSIGTDLHLWDAVIPHLRGRPVIRMDTRGHGRSDAPRGDYSLAMLAADVMAVLAETGYARVAIAGVSLGGMIAMQVALDHPVSVAALLPICTSAMMDRTAWAARVEMVRAGGTQAIVEMAMSRFLSPEFIQHKPEIAASIAQGLRTMQDAGYAGCAAAIRDMDIHNRLRDVRVPTLVVSGNLDTSTPFEGHGRHILASISGAQSARLPAAHLAPLEAPLLLAETIVGFLDEAERGETKGLSLESNL